MLVLLTQQLPIFSANWHFPVSNERAQTQTITIPFVVHNNDEACAHHMELVAARLNALCCWSDNLGMLPEDNKCFSNN